MSAIGSVMVMAWWPSSPWFPCGPAAWSVGAGGTQIWFGARVARAWCWGYQLDLVMPGSSPRWAMDRKQIRHSPNRRYTARGRPHREHLLYPRTLNFGVRLALAIS